MTKRELINKLESLEIDDNHPIVIALRIASEHDFEILDVADSSSGYAGIITVIS